MTCVLQWQWGEGADEWSGHWNSLWGRQCAALCWITVTWWPVFHFLTSCSSQCLHSIPVLPVFPFLFLSSLCCFIDAIPPSAISAPSFLFLFCYFSLLLVLYPMFILSTAPFLSWFTAPVTLNLLSLSFFLLNFFFPSFSFCFFVDSVPPFTIHHLSCPSSIPSLFLYIFYFFLLYPSFSVLSFIPPSLPHFSTFSQLSLLSVIFLLSLFPFLLPLSSFQPSFHHWLYSFSCSYSHSVLSSFLPSFSSFSPFLVLLLSFFLSHLSYHI